MLSKVFIRGLIILTIFIFPDFKYQRLGADQNRLLPIKNINNTNHQSVKYPETIRIGLLLIEDAKSDPLSREAVDGVQMAVDKINRAGGINGAAVEVRIRSCNGMWGAGSKETVNLIYNDSVCAILGSLNGRDAHLAEQVATKSHIVLMASRATDPSLGYAFVPWFFRCIYDDDQQSNTLVKEIYHQKKLVNIAVLHAENYDDKVAASSFIKTAAKENLPKPTIYSFDNTLANFNDIIQEMKTKGFEAVVFYGNVPDLKIFSDRMKNAHLDASVYCPIDALNEYPLKTNLTALCPTGWFADQGRNFRNEFKSKYGYVPGIVAAYSFDGASLIIKSIKKAGTDKQKIRDQLAESKYEGITGQISFDVHGNRNNEACICP